MCDTVQLMELETQREELVSVLFSHESTIFTESCKTQSSQPCRTSILPSWTSSPPSTQLQAIQSQLWLPSSFYLRTNKHWHSLRRPKSHLWRRTEISLGKFEGMFFILRSLFCRSDQVLQNKICSKRKSVIFYVFVHVMIYLTTTAQKIYNLRRFWQLCGTFFVCHLNRTENKIYRVFAK